MQLAEVAVFSPAKTLRQGFITKIFGCRSLNRLGFRACAKEIIWVLLPKSVINVWAFVLGACKNFLLSGYLSVECRRVRSQRLSVTPSRASLARGQAVTVGNVVGSIRFRVWTKRCSGGLYPNARKPRLGLCAQAPSWVVLRRSETFVLSRRIVREGIAPPVIAVGHLRLCCRGGLACILLVLVRWLTVSGMR